MKISKSYDNVFDVLESDPGIAENLRIRAELMREIRGYIESDKLTLDKAAEILAVSQPRITDLVCGKADKFTIDMLVNMLVRAGKTVELKMA